MGFWERLPFKKHTGFLYGEACFSRQTQLWHYQQKCFKRTCACDPVIISEAQTSFPTEETTDFLSFNLRGELGILTSEALEAI